MPIFLRYGWHVIADDLHQLDLHVPPQCIQNIQSVLPTPLPNRHFDCQFVLSDHILLILPSVELSVRLILSLICLILPPTLFSFALLLAIDVSGFRVHQPDRPTFLPWTLSKSFSVTMMILSSTCSSRILPLPPPPSFACGFPPGSRVRLSWTGQHDPAVGVHLFLRYFSAYSALIIWIIRSVCTHHYLNRCSPSSLIRSALDCVEPCCLLPHVFPNRLWRGVPLRSLCTGECVLLSVYAGCVLSCTTARPLSLYLITGFIRPPDWLLIDFNSRWSVCRVAAPWTFSAYSALNIDLWSVIHLVGLVLVIICSWINLNLNLTQHQQE